MEGCFGISTADISTGQCLVTEMDKPRRLVDEITKFMPAEIICNQSFLLCGIDVEDLRTRLHICVNALEDWYFDDDICRRTLQEQFHAATMEGLASPITTAEQLQPVRCSSICTRHRNRICLT